MEQLRKSVRELGHSELLKLRPSQSCIRSVLQGQPASPTAINFRIEEQVQSECSEQAEPEPGTQFLAKDFFDKLIDLRVKQADTRIVTKRRTAQPKLRFKSATLKVYKGSPAGESVCRFINQYAKIAQLKTVMVGPGNNSELVRQILSEKGLKFCLEQVKSSTVLAWTQLSDPSILQRQGSLPTLAYNHICNSQMLCDKKQLLFVLNNFCKHKRMLLNSLIPETYHVSNLNQLSKLAPVLEDRQRKLKCVWIVKPGEESNRGQGIIIASSVAQIEREVAKGRKHRSGNPKTYIIQYYLPDPFLYRSRKFDIRVFLACFATPASFKAFFLEEGYARTSSQTFKVASLDCATMHLTNDSIQKKSIGYGRFQPANKLSFLALDEYLTEQGKSFSRVKDKMKSIAKIAVSAAFPLLQSHRNRNNFQLFGLDFILGRDAEPLLIEFNSNPCLETPCALLARVIRQALSWTLEAAFGKVGPGATLVFSWDKEEDEK